MKTGSGCGATGKTIAWAGTRIIAPKFYLMTPIPGTDLFDDMQEQGRILTDDLLTMTPSKPSMTHPNMSTEELGAIYWEIYDRLYTLRRVLGRTIFQKCHPLSGIE